MDELTVSKTITLNVDTPVVWDALINPEITKEYMFGCEVSSDWKTGGKIQWRRKSKGKDKVYIEGVILRIDRGKLLKYAITSSDARYVDIPSNYIQVTYRLTRKFGKTELTVTQGDYSKVEDGDRRYKEADEGLEYVLDGLKSTVEGRPARKIKPAEDESEDKGTKDLNTSNWLPD